MSEPNIFSLVIGDVNPKIANYIMSLNKEGQIDLDNTGKPYIVSIDHNGSTITVDIMRNDKREHFIVNTRKKKVPLYKSWDDDFVRKEQPDENSQKTIPTERSRRTIYESIIRAIAG